MKSKLFVNQSLASPNGFFGRDVAGKNHPLFGVKRSESTRKKIKENHADVSGANNGRAQKFKITSPDGEIVEVKGGFKKFCLQKNLPYGSMLFVKSGRVFTRGPCVGWTCEKI